MPQANTESTVAKNAAKRPDITSTAKVDFIAMAPEGKEVEELTSKEILQALRKKVSANEYIEVGKRKGVRN